MTTAINHTTKTNDKLDLIYLSDEKLTGASDFLSKDEIEHIVDKFKNDKKRFFTINKLSRLVFVQMVKAEKEEYLTKEAYRNAGNSLVKRINENKSATVQIVDGVNNGAYALACAEGLALGNYQFLKYYSKAGRRNIRWNRLKSCLLAQPRKK